MLKKLEMRNTVMEYKKLVSDGIISFDSYIQRNLVWSKEQSSLLVASVIEDYPIPAFYANKNTRSGIYYNIDGKQRSNALITFTDDKFELIGLDPIEDENGDSIDINGKKFSELPEKWQDKIKVYNILTYFYDDMTEEQESEMFFRLNNGSKLTAIQKARSNCPCIKQISEIAEHDLFKTVLSEKAMNSKVNEDLVTKSYIIYNERTPSFNSNDIQEIMRNMRLDETDVKMLNTTFDKILDTYNKLAQKKDDRSVRAYKHFKARTHLVSLVPITYEAILDNIPEDKYIKFIRLFFGNTGKKASLSEEYNRCSSGSTGQSFMIKSRLSEIKTYWNDIMNGKHDILLDADEKASKNGVSKKVKDTDIKDEHHIENTVDTHNQDTSKNDCKANDETKTENVKSSSPTKKNTVKKPAAKNDADNKVSTVS